MSSPSTSKSTSLSSDNDYVQSKLEEINITNDELNRIGEALKNEEFRQLLRNYVEEIQNPENKKIYEKEIIELEKQRGVDITFITPTPSYVIKTSSNGNAKTFINICSNDKIDKPSSKPYENGLNWQLPYILSKPRLDFDKKQNKCNVYDVVFHPEALELGSKIKSFKQLIHDTALNGIEQNFNIQLDKVNLKFPKSNFKGSIHPSVIRRKSENHNNSNNTNEGNINENTNDDLIQKCETKNNIISNRKNNKNEKKNLNKIIDNNKLNELTNNEHNELNQNGVKHINNKNLNENIISESNTNNIDNENINEEEIDFPVNYPYPPLKENKVKIITDLNKIKKNGVDSINNNYTIPKYILKEYNELNLDQYTNNKYCKSNTTIPIKLIIEIQLPLLNTIKYTKLNINKKSFEFISEKPSKYKLNIKLPYNVNEENGNAKFDIEKKLLIVEIPVVYESRNEYNGESQVNKEQNGVNNEENVKEINGNEANSINEHKNVCFESNEKINEKKEINENNTNINKEKNNEEINGNIDITMQKNTLKNINDILNEDINKNDNNIVKDLTKKKICDNNSKNNKQISKNQNTNKKDLNKKINENIINIENNDISKTNNCNINQKNKSKQNDNYLEINNQLNILNINKNGKHDKDEEEIEILGNNKTHNDINESNKLIVEINKNLDSTNEEKNPNKNVKLIENSNHISNVNENGTSDTSSINGIIDDLKQININSSPNKINKKKNKNKINKENVDDDKNNKIKFENNEQESISSGNNKERNLNQSKDIIIENQSDVQFQTELNSNEFWDKNISYILPEHILNSSDTLLVFVFPIINVENNSLKYLIRNNNIVYLQFSTIGSGFFRSYYGIQIRFEKFITVDDVISTDSNVLLKVKQENDLNCYYYINNISTHRQKEIQYCVPEPEFYIKHNFQNTVSLNHEVPFISTSPISNQVVPLISSNKLNEKKTPSKSSNLNNELNKVPSNLNSNQESHNVPSNLNSENDLDNAPSNEQVNKEQSKINNESMKKESEKIEIPKSKSTSCTLSDNRGKRVRGILKTSFSLSYSSDEDDELDDHERYSSSCSAKKHVRFDEHISRKLYSTKSTISEQEKRHKKKLRHLAHKRERKMSENDYSDGDNNIKSRKHQKKISKNKTQNNNNNNNNKLHKNNNSEVGLTELSDYISETSEDESKTSCSCSATSESAGETSDSGDSIKDFNDMKLNMLASRKSHKKRGKKNLRKNAASGKMEFSNNLVFELDMN